MYNTFKQSAGNGENNKPSEAGNGENNKLLVNAADKGDASLMSKLLADGADPNETDENGITALHTAAWEGHVSVVKLLLANERLRPNMTDTDGDTALIYAVIKGKDLVVSELVSDKRVEINISGKRGTALEEATRFAKNAANDLIKLEGPIVRHSDVPYGLTPDQYKKEQIRIATNKKAIYDEIVTMLKEAPREED